MKISKSIMLAASYIYLFPQIAQAENWTCLNDIDGIEAFASGDMKHADNYSEAKNAGVRVQREHPKTYMFAQAKFIDSGKRAVAICQYSNHVGLVATYAYLDIQRVDAPESCDTQDCKSKPHWRSEWVESSPEGPKGKNRMHVCVVTIDGLDHPSADCAFSGLIK